MVKILRSYWGIYAGGLHEQVFEKVNGNIQEEDLD